jgi:hypothetical protein
MAQKQRQIQLQRVIHNSTNASGLSISATGARSTIVTEIYK